MKKLLLVSLILFLLLQFPVTFSQPVADLIYASTEYVAVPTNTRFKVKVENIYNESIYVFCFTAKNVTRIDAPPWITMTPGEVREYVFESPNVTETADFSIFYAAMDLNMTCFQWLEVTLSVSSIRGLNDLLRNLQYNNTMLQQQLINYRTVADRQNLLIVGVVASNAVWIAALFFSKHGQEVPAKIEA